jgi:hypothetical protein
MSIAGDTERASLTILRRKNNSKHVPPVTPVTLPLIRGEEGQGAKNSKSQEQ